MFEPNYICLFGLLPFAYSSINNYRNIHSISVLIFGILYHGFQNNKYLKYLDIVQCFVNGTTVFYLYSPSRIYGILSFFIYLLNLYYLNNNNYLHVLLQFISWRGISLYENNLLTN